MNLKRQIKHITILVTNDGLDIMRTLALNNNGTFGVLVNSWRNNPPVASMIAEAKENNDEYESAPGRWNKFQAGMGGQIIPPGGVVNLGQ